MAGRAGFAARFYLNELVMRLTARHDHPPALFDAYAQTPSGHVEPGLLQAALRAFELLCFESWGTCRTWG